MTTPASGNRHDEPCYTEAPFWDVLGTWEQAPLEIHEMQFRRKSRGRNSIERARLHCAIRQARKARDPSRALSADRMSDQSASCGENA